MDRKTRRIVIRKVRSDFGSILQLAVKVGRSYETAVIPLQVLTDAVDLIKMDPKLITSDFTQSLVAGHNSTCESLVKAFKLKNKQMQGKGITIDFVKECTDQIIKNFTDGINGKK